MKSSIKITKNGPYAVSGKIPLKKEIILTDDEGYSSKFGQGEKYPLKEEYHLCRCGHSKNKPFCDGTHVEIKFDGTETASMKKFAQQAKKIKGDGIILLDAEDLCAFSRYCHSKKGSVWDSTRNSDNSKAKKEAIKEACNCISGRLVVIKNGKAIEPKLKKSISLIEDPDRDCSGPIWVKGGIQIESSDGKKHECRNRCTLCRCGYSSNKPFCDGTHVSAKFNDGSIKKKRN